MDYDKKKKHLEAIHQEFIQNLCLDTKPVTREKYKKELDLIQKKYGLEEGSEDFMLWVLILISLSPKIEKEEDACE